MKNVNYLKIEKKVKEKKYRADDPRFSGTVTVFGREDGSFFLWPNSFVEKEFLDEGWIVVITEHYGNHLLCKDDLDYEYIEYKRQY